MVEATKLPDELVIGLEESPSSLEMMNLFEPMVKKRTIKGIDEIQYLYVSPRTAIKMHGHDNQWEVWVSLSHRTAYVCLKGEEHELVNKSSVMMILMAIKGHIDYSYEDISSLFRDWGFTVTHGSLVFKD